MSRALHKRYGHGRTRKPSRAEMIEALGLEPESRKRSLSGQMTDRYGATTAEFWDKIRHGTSDASKSARRKLGIEEPS